MSSIGNRSRLDAEAWAKARVLWEADPSMTLGQLGEIVGVSKQAIQQRSKKEGWQKLSSQADIARRAYDTADRVAASEGRAGPSQAIPNPDGEPQKVAPISPAQLSSNIEEVAVGMKARVLDRHRKEVDGVRSHLYKAIQNSDHEKAKLAKTSAEALKIVQELERKSWGLDREEGGSKEDGVVRVVIERKEV